MMTTWRAMALAVILAMTGLPAAAGISVVTSPQPRGDQSPDATAGAAAQDDGTETGPSAPDLGRCLAPETGPDIAIALCTRAIESGGLDDEAIARALVRRGHHFVETDRPARALRDLDQAVNFGKAPPDALVVRARARHAAGDPDGAWADIDRAIGLDPEEATAYVVRGVMRAEDGDSEGALGDFTDAIARAPEDVRGWLGRANTLVAAGQHAGAIADFDVAIARDPGLLAARYNRAGAFLALGRHADAVADYDAVLARAPGHAAALNNRGLALAASGRGEEALDDFSAAIRLDPQNPDPLVNRARLRLATGEIERAQGDLARALAFAPDLPAAYVARAEARRQAGDSDGAYADYHSALRLDHASAEAHNGLAWLHATSRIKRHRDAQAAMSHALQAVALADRPHIRDTLAAAYAEGKHWREAVAEVEAALAALRAEGGGAMTAELEEHLRQYRNRRPWRE